MRTRTHTRILHTSVTYKCHQAELWVQKFKNAANSFHSIYYKLAPPEDHRITESPNVRGWKMKDWGKKRPRTEWQIPFSEIHDTIVHNTRIKVYNDSKTDHPFHLEKRFNRDM